jgi:hypothetical protein
VSWEILTPQTRTNVVALSGTGRPRFRKQIMRMQTIKYRDKFGQRVIHFDRPYLASLVDAYQKQAYDQVPFQLADAANGHNNDPERTRGDLVGVELTADGIDGIFETTPDGAALLEKNPKLGVSCRIVENLERADGSKYPHAIQHVLGTVNPQLTGMRPWERVDLSADQGMEQTWDLSTELMEDKMPDSDTVTMELSPERAARLNELLDDMDASDALAELIEQDPEEADDDSEQESDEQELVPDVDPLDLSNSDEFQLVQATIDTQGQRILELTQQLRDRDLNYELTELARQGLAPAIIAAARPLLAVQSGAVELSSADGTRTDPAEVVRNVLRAVLDLSHSGLAVVELDTETGYVTGAETDTVQVQRDALLKDWADQYPG